MITNRTATEPAQPPRKFDNFAERLNAGHPKRAASTRPMDKTAAAPPKSAPTCIAPDTAARLVQEMNKAQAKAQASAAEAKQRTASERWERANAKVQPSAAKPEHEAPAAKRSSADRWARANAKVEAAQGVHA